MRKMNNTNEELLEEFITTRGLAESTHRSFRTTLRHYCKFQGKSLQELLDEADEEEEKKIRWKNRTIKKRLINYMNYCKENMTLNTAKNYLKMVKIFYHHHEIEIHTLPRFNDRNAKVRTPIKNQDLPTKEILKEAVEIAEPLMQALILFLASSGMSKVDARNLTIQDFIEATSRYHHSEDLKTAIKKMKEYEGERIPIWRGRRQKTNKYFITFNTDEATRFIIHYLEYRGEKLKYNYQNPNNELQPTDKLFKIANQYFSQKFKELNDALGLGTIGDNPDCNVKGYCRLRGHILRKYNATNLEKAGMDIYSINVMQGKSNGSVNDVYFFADEDVLLDKYIKAMEGVLILSEVKEYNRYSAEFLEMEKENKRYKNKIDELQRDMAYIKEHIPDMPL